MSSLQHVASPEIPVVEPTKVRYHRVRIETKSLMFGLGFAYGVGRAHYHQGSSPREFARGRDAKDIVVAFTSNAENCTSAAGWSLLVASDVSSCVKSAWRLLLLCSRLTSVNMLDSHNQDANVNLLAFIASRPRLWCTRSLLLGFYAVHVLHLPVDGDTHIKPIDWYVLIWSASCIVHLIEIQKKYSGETQLCGTRSQLHHRRKRLT